MNSFSIGISRIVIDEKQGIVIGEMDIVFDSKEFGRKKLSEAFVQQWKDNKIVNHRFYFKE